jgi:hypothetical protein
MMGTYTPQSVPSRLTAPCSIPMVRWGRVRFIIHEIFYIRLWHIQFIVAQPLWIIYFKFLKSYKLIQI